MKKIILFDWDDTLFSKTIYKENLISNLAVVCGVGIDEAAAADGEYFENLARSDDFRIEDYLNFFEQKFGKKPDKEIFITDKLGIYSGSLFPEVINILKELKKKGITLGIFSQGFDSLQRLKIKNSGIEDYFDKDLIFIDRDKARPEFISGLPKNSIVIDDKKEVIEAIGRQRADLNPIWINRKDNDNTVTNINRISDLTQML